MRLITSRRFKEVKKWIKDVYARDGYVCTKCGSSKDLHAHHIVSWNESIELRIDLNNGITLCNSCHQKLHKVGTKLSEETKIKIVEARKWYKHSEETKEKQRKNSGRPKGIPMKQEQKELFKKLFTGKKTSEETKTKQRENAGRPKGPMPESEKAAKRLYYSERELIYDKESGRRIWVKKQVR